ncbi:MAG: hypothetical protein FI717_08785 [SAR202 cluster bacterium]|nr:hypothetical protein [SAR202 cluster bacterium]HCP23912.1 hypothetical protein [Dehalococcoidia bacterium]
MGVWQGTSFWTLLGKILLVALLTFGIWQFIHESGHWLGYTLVGVDSEIGWLKVTPDEEALTNFKQVVGLLFGLFFQVLPGCVAGILLIRSSLKNRTQKLLAKAVLISSLLPRATFILITMFAYLVTSNRPNVSRLGDEGEILRILDQFLPLGLGWPMILALTAAPIAMFAAVWWKTQPAKNETSRPLQLEPD